MPLNTDAQTVEPEAPQNQATAGEKTESETLQTNGEHLASQLAWLPRVPTSHIFAKRSRQVRSKLFPVLAAVDASFAQSPLSDDARWLRDNASLVYSELATIHSDIKLLRKLPHVRTGTVETLPRVLAFAQGYFRETAYHFQEQTFATFCSGFQKATPLELREFNVIGSALKLVLLEEIARRAAKVLDEPEGKSHEVGVCVQSLREVSQTSWSEVLEPLMLIGNLLRQDPAGAYAGMDSDSRSLYRKKVSTLAARSDLTEIQVAKEALSLARQAHARTYRDPRIARRESHIGYYLVGEGRNLLADRIGRRPNLLEQLRPWMWRHPDKFFLPGIAILTLSIITATLLFVTTRDSSPALILIAMLLYLLPGSQCAIQILDSIITELLPAEILPKLDYSKGIPADCLTLVAVPTLLLNEKQVHGLIEDLEVRFLGNHDPNMHFALLSDLADSDHRASEENPLIELCSSLIRELNQKYGDQKKGSFFLLHRHRIYNPREKGWMGWERKRGKLLDLNKFLRGQFDSFPIKVGDLPILSKVRFVITLDSDTELPRGSAHRMVGALAHPLNQAIIDPQKNIVVAGYGILQPRVGVSVFSTVRSRLAAIYAGQTGLDIYTRAVSDAYQDLYGEGSFTGKGIYEVDTVHTVLDQRFPRNALLSHDLIEGAYARAGLASDIEVIEDYPSHYSAYNRRKHRWLRGDWQIAGWLLSDVPDEAGARVANPISLISRWKILDNLRRSLVEPATFLLLIFGWLAPGIRPARWTLATVFLLFVPAFFQLVMGVIKAIVEDKLAMVRDVGQSFIAGLITTSLTLIFVAHQTLLSLDAVVRAIVRAVFTRERLLEWETAAEAELSARLAPADRYLNWIPVLSIAVGVLVWWAQPASLYVALPILLLWASSKLVSIWLNRPAGVPRRELPRKELLFLRRSALHTWRYYAQFCTEEHHWLVPDNVQEEPAAVAGRVSPTNLGLLLNAQQVACEFGYLTVPEMSVQTQRTLATLSRIPKHRGHILNWYDTRTLEPLTPRFISSVDSGNLVASLWTLQQGLLARIKQPLLQPGLAEGLLDCLRTLAELRGFARKQLSQCEQQLKTEKWLPALLALCEAEIEEIPSAVKPRQAEEIAWFQQQTRIRLQRIQDLVRSYAPWELPEFASVRNDIKLGPDLEERPSLRQLPIFIDDLHSRLERALPAISRGDRGLYENLQSLLPQARTNALRLIESLRSIAAEAGKLADAMDFGFLLNPRRKLMSVGFNVETQKLEPACYDLLATESRTAVFAAVAKEDVPQETWFRMGRTHTLVNGNPVLRSWTGTMFEYLMPTLWMRSYPNTLLDRTRVAVVDYQQTYANRKGVPWGISESAYYKLDEAGNYQYHAFGVPQLAMTKGELNLLVISPYSTFLGLTVNASEALRNLHRMDRMGWFGPYGFYEAADYGPTDKVRRAGCRLVRSWMAHHQGMSLLAIANFLCDNVVQRWFHNSRRVQATELLLHEKPISHVPRTGLPRANAA
jgi:cyclic beta-1,2-glucan synthetase